jgi:hypothetical protein
VLNKDTEEAFMLEGFIKQLTAASYWWCLEFVAKTPQLLNVIEYNESNLSDKVAGDRVTYRRSTSQI